MAKKKQGVKIILVDKDAKMPIKATKGSGCIDIYTLKDCIVPSYLSHNATLIRTGIRMEIPEGYTVKIALRSGIAKNSRLRLANAIGIIDSDYKGEICFICDYLGHSSVAVPKHTRIAQAWIEKVDELPFVTEDDEEISSKEKRSGGFGSTGLE